MKKVKIVIVDDCPSLCKALSEELNSFAEFDVVKTICDPTIATEEIRRIRPDILLQDVVMPSLDGDDILESLKETLDYNLGIIVLSPITNDMTITHYSNLGAHYFVPKPINYKKLTKRIKQLYENLNNEATAYSKGENIKNDARNDAQNNIRNDADEKKLSAKITKLLLRTGINPKLKGFYFLKESIYFICSSGNELCSVTKIVYPKIAKDFGTEAEKVERAIRTAIEKAFSSAEYMQNYYEALGSHRAVKTSKNYPSNREFICTMAEYVKNGDSIDLIC